MKGELVWGIASTSTCLALMMYIVVDKRGRHQPAEGKRDAYLQMLCNNLHSLPNEEWDRVQAKLDVFMGLSSPTVSVSAPPPPPLRSPVKRESPVKSAIAAPAPVPAPPAATDSPELMTYRKMLKMGIPEQAVRNKMITDKVDPALLFGEASNVTTTAPVAIAQHALAKPPVILNLESTPADSLSQHSFWRNASNNNAVVVLDRNVSRAIKVLFHAAPKQRRTLKQCDENRTPNAAAAKSVIPARRAQNIQIGLIKLKRTPQQLCNQINTMEISIMDELQLLDNILPSAEEMKLVTASNEDSSVAVDQFVRCVAEQCKDAKQRVRCMMFVNQNGCEDLCSMVTEMTSFCALMLAQSSEFARLLEAVRLVLCALNRTSKQSKDALSIRALGDTLIASKTRNSKFTVAHLVVAQFKSMQNNSSNLVEAFSGGMMRAQFSSLAAMDAQVRMLEKEIRLCEQYSEAALPLDAIKQQVAKVKFQLQSLKDAYSCLLEVFGEAADRAFTDFYQDAMGLVRCIDLASDCTSQVLGVLANALEE